MKRPANDGDGDARLSVSAGEGSAERLKKTLQKADADIVRGAIGFGFGGVILVVVILLLGKSPDSGNAAVFPGAIGAVAALYGLVRLSQGLVSRLFKVRIDAGDLGSLTGREKIWTILFAIGWVVFVLYGAMKIVNHYAPPSVSVR